MLYVGSFLLTEAGFITKRTEKMRETGALHQVA